MIPGGVWLVVGGALSVTASALHLATIVGGPAWYRWMGAGERLARAAEEGKLRPAVMTFAIAAVLALWAAFAFSGAGLIARLPLTGPALVAISAVYLLRGLVLFHHPLLCRPDLSADFLRWSSAVVLALGLVHAVGTWKAWLYLNGET